MQLATPSICCLFAQTSIHSHHLPPHLSGSLPGCSVQGTCRHCESSSHVGKGGNQVTSTVRASCWCCNTATSPVIYNNTDLSSHSPGGGGLKSGCPQGCVPLEALERPCFLAFAVSKGSFGSQPLLPPPHLCSVVTSPPLTLTLLPPFLKDTCDCIGPP